MIQILYCIQSELPRSDNNNRGHLLEGVFNQDVVWSPRLNGVDWLLHLLAGGLVSTTGGSLYGSNGKKARSQPLLMHIHAVSVRHSGKDDLK